MSTLSKAILTAIRGGHTASATDAIKTALQEKVTTSLAKERRGLSEGLLREKIMWEDTVMVGSKVFNKLGHKMEVLKVEAGGYRFQCQALGSTGSPIGSPFWVGKSDLKQDAHGDVIMESVERKAFAVTFKRNGKETTWTRFYDSQEDADKDAPAVIKKEYPDGSAKLVSVKPTADPRKKVNESAEWDDIAIGQKFSFQYVGTSKPMNTVFVKKSKTEYRDSAGMIPLRTFKKHDDEQLVLREAKMTKVAIRRDPLSPIGTAGRMFLVCPKDNIVVDVPGDGDVSCPKCGTSFDARGYIKESVDTSTVEKKGGEWWLKGSKSGYCDECGRQAFRGLYKLHMNNMGDSDNAPIYGRMCTGCCYRMGIDVKSRTFTGKKLNESTVPAGVTARPATLGAIVSRRGEKDRTQAYKTVSKELEAAVKAGTIKTVSQDGDTLYVLKESDDRISIKKGSGTKVIDRSEKGIPVIDVYGTDKNPVGGKRRKDITEARVSLKCNECGKKFSASTSSDPECPKCGGVDYDVLSEASKKLAIAAKDSDGNVSLILGNDELALSRIYNGWKASGSKYSRVAQGKLPASLSDDEAKKRMAQQFGVSVDKVKVTINEAAALPPDLQKLANDYDSAYMGLIDCDGIDELEAPYKRKMADIVAKAKAKGYKLDMSNAMSDGATFVKESADEKKTCKCGKKFTPSWGEHTRCPDCLGKQHDAGERATRTESFEMPAKEVQRVFDETGDRSETEILCGIKGLKVDGRGNVVSYMNESMSDDEEDQLRDRLSTLRIKWRKASGAGRDAIEREISKIRTQLNEGPEFKKIGQPLAPVPTRVSRINKYLAEIGRTYHQQIPLDGIFAKVREHGFEPVQEDGTSWSGMLLGRSERANIGLRDEATGKVSKWLTLSWHKMDVSGKFEVTAYVS